jgi:hypothetical protein
MSTSSANRLTSFRGEPSPYEQLGARAAHHSPAAERSGDLDPPRAPDRASGRVAVAAWLLACLVSMMFWCAVLLLAGVTAP